MAGRDIVVVGFSAGGIAPLTQLVGDIPSDFPASMFVVHHFPAQSISALPSILSRAGPLPATQPADGERIVPGRIYVARPDRHLLIRDGCVRVTTGPREHGHRPAIDPLFRSAARSYGPRVVGIILSGTLDDGTLGLLEIKEAGGLAVVQDPASAAYPGMPASAIEHVSVDHVVSPAELGPLLDRLVHGPPPAGAPAPADPLEPAVVGTAALRIGGPPGQPSGLVCPECGGVLWQSETGALVHFRCHVGHAYSAESLLTGQSDALERALWGAVRALEEKARLSRHLAELARARGLQRAHARYDGAADDAEQGSNMIRETLLKGPVREALEAPAELPELREAERQTGSGPR
jgi:two-component system, chemotaxis family, protein-glutamate methylesterase/glutaminase